MSVLAWDSTPSPQPSPQRGEGLVRAASGPRSQPAATALRRYNENAIAPIQGLSALLEKRKPAWLGDA